MSFKSAVNNMNTSQHDNVAFTANGARSLKSSLNPLVDLFFIIGSLRNKTVEEYFSIFERAFNQNEFLTLQMLLWARDIRGGAGERNTVRQILLKLEKTRPDAVKMLIPVFAEYGRWDDVLIFKTPEVKAVAFETIKKALLIDKNALAAKWMPRERKLKLTKAKGCVDKSSVSNQNRIKQNALVKELCEYMSLTERQYRKLCSSLSSTVEQQMSAGDFDNIEYGKLPSLAIRKYTKAFKNRDGVRYQEYLDSLEKGEATVNASTLYPYDVLVSLKRGDAQLANAQWEALPNFLGDNSILPMVDTSGSMTCSAGGSSLTCMDVAVSLGLYVADKQQGAFNNMVLTFSERPNIYEISGKDLSSKYSDMQRFRHDWGMNTNISKAFDKILEVATKQQVPQSDMPKFLLILSDMEFDEGASFGKTAHEEAEMKFKRAGYEIPKVVFWNLNARPSNNPVRFDKQGTAMVSGFSPNILKSILAGQDFDPVQIMLDTINAPRYQIFSDAE